MTLRIEARITSYNVCYTKLLRPGVNATSVAELTICQAIMGLRHVLSRNLLMREGKRPMQALGRLLSGRTFGIHGCGHVGREVVRLLQRNNFV